MATFKIAVMGSPKVGKTAFVSRNRNGKFDEEYTPTSKVKYQTFSFNTTVGTVMFNIIDIPGDKILSQEDSFCYKNLDGAIIMFDITSKESFKDSEKWYFEFIKYNKGGFPVIFIGNKCDIQEKAITNEEIQAKFKPNYNSNVLYFDMSIKSRYNIEKPLLYLAKKLCNEKNLTFIEPGMKVLPTELPTEIVKQPLMISSETIDLAKFTGKSLCISVIYNTTFIKKTVESKCFPEILLPDGLVDGFVKNIICIDDSINTSNVYNFRNDLKTYHNYMTPINCINTRVINKGKSIQLFRLHYNLSANLIWNAELKVWFYNN